MWSALRSKHLDVALASVLLTTPWVVAEVITKPDGLQIKDTRLVKCDRPAQAGDTVYVHYTGTLEDGFQFDESWDRGRPFAFKLGAGEVIKGWDEGIAGMCVGSRRKLTIPPGLGYGARGAGAIPPNSILIFETQLMKIKGIPDPPPAPGPPPPPPPPPPMEELPAGSSDDGERPFDDDKGSPGGPQSAHQGASNGECRLLGPFALIVQAALGVLALMSLVIKRWREHPRRPVKVWFFDVSKQVVGTALLHVANLAMSMLSSGIDPAAKAHRVAEANKGDDDRMPNPCSFYLLNLAIDTTIGIPILVILLRVLHALFLRTPLANPPESLKSGHYGNPPRGSWWVKQSLIYFLGLFGMKLFVLFLFTALPWLPWVGDWALRWTEGNESIQIAFVMFIFPLAMNAIQYYIIDSFIKEKAGEQGYETVASDERDGAGDNDNSHVVGDDDGEDSDSKTRSVDESGKSGSDSTLGENSESRTPPKIPRVTE